MKVFKTEIACCEDCPECLKIINTNNYWCCDRKKYFDNANIIQEFCVLDDLEEVKD
jgi:hypothetical protein